MIAGGAEAAITPMGIGGFCAMRALSRRNDEPEKASRPFEKNRDGFVVGEGSGVLIIESLESAQKRGASIYAEIVGYGLLEQRITRAIIQFKDNHLAHAGNISVRVQIKMARLLSLRTS